MDANSPRAKLAELVARHGPAAIIECGRCEKLLLEACGTGFRDEVASLAAAAEQGVAKALQDSVLSSEPRAVLIDRLSRLLAKNTKLSPYAARWSVECWALALGIVRDSDYLMLTKLAQIQPLIDEACIGGPMTDHTAEQLVTKARTHGIDEAYARAHVAKYTRPKPGVAEVSPEPGSTAEASPAARKPRALRRLSPPGPGPAPDSLPPSMTSGAPRAGPTHAVSQPPGTRAGARIVVITGLCLVVVAMVAAVGPSIRSAYVADREHRAYEAAHDNIDALVGYLNGCEICAFRDAAQAEVNRLRAAAEERTYRAAGSDPRALQSYVDKCAICAFKQQALNEIARLREEQTYRAARGHRDALRAYLAECRVCAFGEAARSELAELSRVADDEQAYRSARGSLSALRAYVAACGRCAFRQPALEEILQLELLAVRPPAASADLEGVVRGASSAATLYVIVSARNPRVISTKPGETVSVELFGIVDPLGKSSENPHVAALRNYLDKAQRKVECFAREEQTFQCFVGGNDLAVMALHDGIAKPGPNSLTEYKQAAR
jgi:hypothetical protein